MQALRPTHINVIIWKTLVVVAEVYVFSYFLLYWLPRIVLHKTYNKRGIEATRNRKLLIVLFIYIVVDSCI